MAVQQQGAGMNVSTRDWLESHFQRLGEKIESHQKENDKDHSRYEKEFFDISQVIQQDRSTTNQQLTKISDNLQSIAALAAQIAELKEKQLRSSEQIGQLYDGDRELKQDINNLGTSIREALAKDHTHLVEEVDAKLERMGSRVTDLEVRQTADEASHKTTDKIKGQGVNVSVLYVTLAGVILAAVIGLIGIFI